MSDKRKLHSISRLEKSFPLYKEIMKQHKEAIKKGEDTYTDPRTGFSVFTAEYLFKKGFCCGSGCRHCPY
jgi:hypothetical protein